MEGGITFDTDEAHATEGDTTIDTDEAYATEGDTTIDTDEAYGTKSQHQEGDNRRAGGPGKQRDHQDHHGHSGKTDGHGCAGQRRTHSNMRGAGPGMTSTSGPTPRDGPARSPRNISHLQNDGCGGGGVGRGRGGSRGHQQMPHHARTAAIAGGCVFAALAAVFVVRRRRNRGQHDAQPSAPPMQAPLPVPIAPGVPVALVDSPAAKDATITAAI